MYKNSIVHYLTKIFVDILFYCGIMSCILVPFMSDRLAVFFGYGEEFTLCMNIVILSSGIAAVYILYQLKKIFKTLLGGNPFVSDNVTCFRKISVSCCLISLIYTIKSIVWFSLGTAIIVVIFALATLFCLTLKDVFKQAVLYKDENDLTV